MTGRVDILHNIFEKKVKNEVTGTEKYNFL